MPPSNAVIRTMAIHKTPQLVGENVICCPRHIEEQAKNGLSEHTSFSKYDICRTGVKHCQHFVRGGTRCQTNYHEDPINGRLSISMPVGTLQQSKTALDFISHWTLPHNTTRVRDTVTSFLQVPMLHIRAEKRSGEAYSTYIYTRMVSNSLRCIADCIHSPSLVLGRCWAGLSWMPECVPLPVETVT